jgi:hypothetical protein
MTDITVKTSGSFMLLDRFSGREIPPLEAVTVPLTEFIAERLKLGQLVKVSRSGSSAPAEAPTTKEVPDRDNDVDNDGHDDETGEFVDGNKPKTRGRRKNS